MRIPKGFRPKDQRSEIPKPGSERSAGPPAPEFSLHTTPDQTVKLSEFRGKPVVLAFYPADWSPVCGDQMALYNELLSEFQNLGAQLLGISVDGGWCHAAFSQNRKLHFPLLADFEPKGAVARLYGVYRESDGRHSEASAGTRRPTKSRNSHKNLKLRTPHSAFLTGMI